MSKKCFIHINKYIIIVLMLLEVRIKKDNAEIHVVDDQNNRPISIIKSQKNRLSSDIINVMRQYDAKKVKRVRKPLLCFS